MSYPLNIFNCVCLLIGLILQNGSCIAVSQCPCVYHGTSYVQGHVLQQGCSVWSVECTTLCILLCISVLYSAVLSSLERDFDAFQCSAGVYV